MLSHFKCCATATYSHVLTELFGLVRHCSTVLRCLSPSTWHHCHDESANSYGTLANGHCCPWWCLNNCGMTRHDHLPIWAYNPALDSGTFGAEHLQEFIPNKSEHVLIFVVANQWRWLHNYASVARERKIGKHHISNIFKHTACKILNHVVSFCGVLFSVGNLPCEHLRPLGTSMADLKVGEGGRTLLYWEI